MNRVFAAACAAACLTFSAAHADGAFVLDDASLDKVTAAGFVRFNVRFEIIKTPVGRTMIFDTNSNGVRKPVINAVPSAEGTDKATG